jgi:hypothetical protein
VQPEKIEMVLKIKKKKGGIPSFLISHSGFAGNGNFVSPKTEWMHWQVQVLCVNTAAVDPSFPEMEHPRGMVGSTICSMVFSSAMDGH